MQKDDLKLEANKHVHKLLNYLNYFFITYLCCKFKLILQLECGPMPNVMTAQLNIGCKHFVIPFLVPRRKVWLTPAAGVLCSNAANIGEHKTWM